MADLVVGYVGRLHALTIRPSDSERKLCIKFTETSDEADYDDLPVDERIYAARPSNFHGAYQVLTSSGLPVPALHGSGAMMVDSTQWIRATIDTNEKLILPIINPLAV